MDLANSVLKDVLADATLTCEARTIERQLTAPDTTEASMEGLGKMIGGWLKSRERKKAENAAKEGKHHGDQGNQQDHQDYLDGKLGGD